jgi:hypothetical protein
MRYVHVGVAEAKPSKLPHHVDHGRERVLMYEDIHSATPRGAEWKVHGVGDTKLEDIIEKHHGNTVFSFY